MRATIANDHTRELSESLRALANIAQARMMCCDLRWSANWTSELHVPSNRKFGTAKCKRTWYGATKTCLGRILPVRVFCLFISMCSVVCCGARVLTSRLLTNRGLHATAKCKRHTHKLRMRMRRIARWHDARWARLGVARLALCPCSWHDKTLLQDVQIQGAPAWRASVPNITLFTTQFWMR